MIELEKNKYYQQWLRGYQSMSAAEGERDAPNKEVSTSRSLSMTRETFPSLNVATMDMAVEDVVLPINSNKAVKVPGI